MFSRRESGRRPGRDALLAGLLLLAAAASALSQVPGPAPIVVSKEPGGAVRVKAGGAVRILPRASARGFMTARATPEPSAFAPPPGSEELAGAELAGADEGLPAVGEASLGSGEIRLEEPFARGYSPSSELNRRMGRPSLVTERPSGYQPSSRLNENLPGQGSQPVAEGYQPSSTLNERLVANSLGTAGAWRVGDKANSAEVLEWSRRGARSRGE